MKLISLLLLFHVMQVNGHVADKQYFSVWRGDDQVGTLTTWRKSDGPRTVFHLCSDVRFDLLWSVKINEQITDVFEYGHLKSSPHRRRINDDLRVSNQVVTGDEGHQVSTIHEESNIISEKISFSVLNLYFQEPKGQLRVYSQSHRQLVAIHEIQEHVYRIDLPNGATTTYSYSDGLLQQVESKTYLGTIRFVRDVQNELSKK